MGGGVVGGGVVGSGEVRWGGGRITNTLVMQLVKIVTIFHLPFFQHSWTYFENGFESNSVSEVNF